MTAIRRPTIRLGYILELVATAAVCFALIRMQASSRGPVSQVGSSGWTRLVGGSILTGLGLAGGVGLAVEAVRGRSPSTWGLGRWIWSIAVAFMLFHAAMLVAGVLVNHGYHPTRVPTLGTAIGGTLRGAAVHQFFGGFGWTIAAVCATSMLAGTPRDPEPDAREWAGRLFASLAVALNIAVPLLGAAGQ